MSPSPAPRPVNLPPFVLDPSTNPPAEIPVVISRGVPASRLPDVERIWSPERAALTAAGVQLPHGHWDWRNKLQFYTPGTHCLVAVEVGGVVQGLMAVETNLRPSRLPPVGWVVYVDFVEVAPWNLAVPGVQTPRFGSVGTLLVAEAVRMSMGRTAGGRVGLHSLPGVEAFYARRCRMTDLGPDNGYHGLVYFEYPDGVTADWLTDRRYSA